MTCPGWPWHGAGPYVSSRCYYCLKACALAGQPLPEEARAYAGFPPPRPRPRDGWRPADALRWPGDLEPLERRHRYVAATGLRALAEALARISGERP